MYFLYNILVNIVWFVLKIIAVFNAKIRLFVEGRKTTFAKLKNEISVTDKVVWMHCASLGEFEQGRPVLEKIKQKFPEYKLVVTFFSPSGYEVRKNYDMANVVCYLPFDTQKNSVQFLNTINPEIAIFVKYEFWPNILKELQKRAIQTILISGIFRANQLFFKSYGGWFKKPLQAFSYFFVQDKKSKELLNSIQINNVMESGDTRFDRVYEITLQNNSLPFIEDFVDNRFTLVAGSTWKDDENLLVNYINNEAEAHEKFIIAPHNITKEGILELKKSISKEVVLFSEKDDKNLQDYQVFIVDTIGILTKIYSYAHVAYVGGGYTKSGVHNVLEPATFGVPILIGPNFYKFNEAVELVENEACFVADNSQKLSVHLKTFLNQKSKRENTGSKALNYVLERRGATGKILNYIENERKVR